MRADAPRSAFGTELRAVRREQGVTQLDLALAAGCADATYLSRIENGRRQNPSSAFIARVLRGFVELGKPLTDAQRERLVGAAFTQQLSNSIPAAMVDALAGGASAQRERGEPSSVQEIVVRVVMEFPPAARRRAVEADARPVSALPSAGPLPTPNLERRDALALVPPSAAPVLGPRRRERA